MADDLSLNLDGIPEKAHEAVREWHAAYLASMAAPVDPAAPQVAAGLQRNADVLSQVLACYGIRAPGDFDRLNAPLELRVSLFARRLALEMLSNGTYYGGCVSAHRLAQLTLVVARAVEAERAMRRRTRRCPSRRRPSVRPASSRAFPVW